MVAPEGEAVSSLTPPMGGPLRRFFLSEFLPYIETHYRVIRDRKTRGITGLSMAAMARCALHLDILIFLVR